MSQATTPSDRNSESETGASLMSRCNDKNRRQLVEFMTDAPFDDVIIEMDCKDGCEQLARLAELVAAGGDLHELLPEFEEHIGYWKDCREEFEALVAVIKAERASGFSPVSDDVSASHGHSPAEKSPRLKIDPGR
jgi:hypothetical protein